MGSKVRVTWRLFAICPFAFLSAGHHDHSLVVSDNQSNMIQVLHGHQDVVTVVDMDGDHIVSGSRDLTLRLWKVASGVDGSVRFRVGETSRGIFFGHDAEISCVCLRAKLDLCVSGADDGSVLVHEISSRCLIRTLMKPEKGESSKGGRSVRIGIVRVSLRGDIFVYSEAMKMYVFSINGMMLARDEMVKDAVTCAVMTRNGEFLITGSADGWVSVRRMINLEEVHRMRAQAPVTSISLTPDEHNVVCGMEDGNITLISGQFPNKSDSGKQK